MKEIVIVGKNATLEAELKQILGDRYTLTESVGRPLGGTCVAVVCVHGPSDLDVMEGADAAFVVVADTADDAVIDRAVSLGARYFFVSPVSAETLAFRLDWLASECMPHAAGA